MLCICAPRASHTHSCIHAFTHSCIDAFTHSRIHTFTYSRIHTSPVPVPVSPFRASKHYSHVHVHVNVHKHLPPPITTYHTDRIIFCGVICGKGDRSPHTHQIKPGKPHVIYRTEKCAGRGTQNPSLPKTYFAFHVVSSVIRRNIRPPQTPFLLQHFLHFVIQPR